MNSPTLRSAAVRPSIEPRALDRWAAQVRLCACFRRLAVRKLPHNKVVVAIARELTGFVWAIMREANPGAR